MKRHAPPVDLRPYAVRGAVLAWLWTAGCNDRPRPEDDSGRQQAKPMDTQARRKAHQQAYERLLPLAQQAFAVGDPIAAAELGLGPLTPPPLDPASREGVRQALEPAWRESTDIDPDLLGAQEAALLRAIRFGLARLRDTVVRHPLTRTDPTYAPWVIARLLAAIDQRSGASCQGCGEALAAAGPALTAGLADLAAASAAGLQGAQHQLTALDQQLTALMAREDLAPLLRERDRSLREAIVAAQARLADLAAHQPAAPDRTWTTPVAPMVLGAPRLSRLPDTLGAQALRRRLEVEEDLDRPAAELLDEVQRMLGWLHGAAKAESTTPPRRADPPIAVTEARCEALWAPLFAFAQTQGAIDAAQLHCAQALPRLPAFADDATLVAALVELGIRQPVARSLRTAVVPALALLQGRIAPASQALAQPLAILTAMKLGPARELALQSAQAALCRTAATLWRQAEMGTQSEFERGFVELCRASLTQDWHDAATDPRAGLTGLGLTLVARGPADAVALDRLWWLPLGLVIPLARPAAPPAPEVPPQIHVESLDPGTGAEAQGRPNP